MGERRSDEAGSDDDLELAQQQDRSLEDMGFSLRAPSEGGEQPRAPMERVTCFWFRTIEREPGHPTGLVCMLRIAIGNLTMEQRVPRGGRPLLRKVAQIRREVEQRFMAPPWDLQQQQVDFVFNRVKIAACQLSFFFAQAALRSNVAEPEQGFFVPRRGEFPNPGVFVPTPPMRFMVIPFNVVATSPATTSTEASVQDIPDCGAPECTGCQGRRVESAIRRAEAVVSEDPAWLVRGKESEEDDDEDLYS